MDLESPFFCANKNVHVYYFHMTCFLEITAVLYVQCTICELYPTINLYCAQSYSVFIKNSLTLKTNVIVATFHFEETEREDKHSMEWYNGISPSSEMSLWCEWYARIDALSFLCHLSLCSFFLLSPAYSEWAFDVDLRMVSKCNEVKLVSAVLWLEGGQYI